jgi:putative phage-type endonuclease
MLTEREKWLDSRRKGLGGSDSPVVLGVSPFMTRRELALDKLGLLPGKEESPAMRRGKRLEEVAVEMFTEKTGIGLVTRNEIMTHPELGWWRANIDRETIDGTTVVEVKVPGWRQFSKIKREGLSDYIQVQNQHYLMHPKFKRGIYIILSIEEWDVLWFEQEPDAELQEIIMEKDGEFWKMLQDGIIPDEEQLPTIELPSAQGSIVMMGNTLGWNEAVRELYEAQEIRKEAESLEETAKAEIRKLMGNASSVESDGFRAYMLNQKGRKTIDAKKLEKEFPSAYESCLKKGKPFQKFSPYFLKGYENE